MVAVLFDLGNVLVRLCPERGFARLRRLVPGLEGDLAWLQGLPEVDAVARGALNGPAFLRALGRRLGAQVADEQLRELWCDSFDPWPEMEALAESVIAGGTATYLASNTDPLHYAFLAARMPVLARMRGVHLSFEVGALKPTRAFYERALARSGLSAEQCLFLDDRSENVDGARAMGVRGRVFDGDVAAAREFLRAGGVAL